MFYDGEPANDWYDFGWSVAEDDLNGDIFLGGESIDTAPDMEWWILKVDPGDGDVDSDDTDLLCDLQSAELTYSSTSASSQATTVILARTDANPSNPQGSASSTSLSPQTLCDHTP